MEENILDSGSTNDISPPPSTNDVENDDHSQYIKGKKKYQCKICNNYFTISHLPYHVKALHSEENIYTCKICGEVFKQKYYFNVHMKSHDDLKPYKCETCGQRFVRKYSLKQHQELHSNLQFTCKICKKTFKRNVNLKVHEKTHSNDKKYGCEICGKRFYIRCHLKYHFKLHSFKVQCSICNRNFSSKRQMKLHKNIHTGNFQHPFTCPVCFKFFFKLSILKNHVKIHNNSRHVSGDSSNTNQSKKKSCFACNVCKQTCVSKSALKIHKRQHTGEMPYTCVICQRSFRYSSTLKMHRILKHNATDANYRCKICNKGFYSKTHCNDHMNGHTGNKPYQCKICQKQFSTISSIYGHMKSQHSAQGTKNQNYKCEFCGKSCCSPSARIVHMRKHTGRCPFYCDKCGKSFPSKYARNTHMNTHTLPFECGICNVKYSRRIDLVRHVETHKAVERNTTETKSALDNFEFNSHMNTGTQTLSFECGICHVRYSRRKNMLKHAETHKEIERKTTEANSEINLHMNRQTLPFECGICHVQYSSRLDLLRHVETHRAVEGNTTEANSEINYVQDQFGFKVHEQRNTQSEDGFSIVSLKTESSIATSSEIGKDGIGGNKMCNFENSVMKIEINQTQERNINLTSVSLSGEKVPSQLDCFDEGCFTQSTPQLISLNHNETNKTAENLGVVKSELQINQTVNSGQVRNDNVFVMKKIGSFKVSKEELEQILSGKTLIKPEVSQNNPNKSS